MESQEEDDPLFRVHFKLHNTADEPDGHVEFYVTAECENTAVVKVLQYATAPTEFGSINVSKLTNATIVS